MNTNLGGFAELKKVLPAQCSLSHVKLEHFSFATVFSHRWLRASFFRSTQRLISHHTLKHKLTHQREKIEREKIGRMHASVVKLVRDHVYGNLTKLRQIAFLTSAFCPSTLLTFHLNY